MKVIPQQWEYVSDPFGTKTTRVIEQAGRTCYKSERFMEDGSDEEFIRKAVKLGHTSVLEHGVCSVRVYCDRAVSHEIVRHRIGMSYSQESQRYCNYGKGQFEKSVTFILPHLFANKTPLDPAFDIWAGACVAAEAKYFELLDIGWAPQDARHVLPNATKTEIVITGNPVAWRHFFRLRCSKAAWKQIRLLSLDMLDCFNSTAPSLFEDLADQFKEDIVAAKNLTGQ